MEGTLLAPPDISNIFPKPSVSNSGNDGSLNTPGLFDWRIQTFFLALYVHLTADFKTKSHLQIVLTS